MISSRAKRICTEALLIASILLIVSCAASSQGSNGFVQIYSAAPKGINYRELGIVETQLKKNHLENMDWWRQKIESRLRKKAKEMGADALIHPRFDPVTGHASAVAIKIREIFPEKSTT